jgi:Sec-independent protein translocase protein TatA
MEILGIGPAEALLIVIVALVVVGPKELGKAARSTGRLLNRLYKSDAWKSVTQASRNLRTLPSRLAREAALEELDEMRASLREAEQTVTGEIQEVRTEFGAWQGREHSQEKIAPDPEINEVADQHDAAASSQADSPEAD